MGRAGHLGTAPAPPKGGQNSQNRGTVNARRAPSFCVDCVCLRRSRMTKTPQTQTLLRLVWVWVLAQRAGGSLVCGRRIRA